MKSVELGAKKRLQFTFEQLPYQDERARVIYCRVNYDDHSGDIIEDRAL